MKLAPKFPVAIFAGVLALLSISCSKKSTPTPSPYWLVTTFAGSGVAGSTNGTGTAASFLGPTSVATDVAGNVYVTDGNSIRKITPDGMVSTLAATAAGFNEPFGIVVDVSGNVYVADSGNNLIRKITPGGVVTTFAGSGASSALNGTGTAASFNFPNGVALDLSGNVYVADAGDNTIRKVSPAGVVTTLAGTGSPGSANGPGTAASFNYPQALTVDPAGNVFVADEANQLIRKITPDGVVTTFAGSGVAGSADGMGTAASFNEPDGVAFDAADNLYVVDEASGLVRKITPSGMVTTIAGGSIGFANGIGSAASFSYLWGVTVDKSGNIYVADWGNLVIRKIVEMK